MKKSLTEVISEEKFLPIVQEHSKRFLGIYHLLKRDYRPFTRRYYAYLIEESEDLETFLDDHCARENKTWYLFGELVACIRNLAKVAFILRHVLNRHPAYNLADNQDEQYFEEAQRVIRFLDQTLLALFEAIKKESLNLGMAFPEGNAKVSHFGEIYPQKRLPYTIDEKETFNAQEIVAGIVSRYLEVVERFESYGWHGGKIKISELKQMIPVKINEERSREISALIHNLQSTYDHYIKRTPLESQDVALKRFRGYISMPLHHLTMVNWLSHLYRRHVYPSQRGKIGHRLSELIRETDLLEIIGNFALFYAYRYLQTGRTFAQELYERYADVDTCEVRVPHKLGFHLRPASLVVKLANYYRTKLYLMVDGQEYDASNILSITMAAGQISRKGYQTVLFRGDKRLIQGLKRLSEHNYGEDEKGNPTSLPPEFDFLLG
jgi:hypothetical protein